MNEFEAAKATSRAVEEGRVHGKYRCPRCGMRSNHKADAMNCCKGLGPPASQRLPDARFERKE